MDTATGWVDLLFKLATLAALVGSVALYWLQGRFVRRDEHEALVRRVANHDKRVVDFEGRCREVDRRLTEAPGHDDVHQIMLELSETKGEVKALAAEMRGFSDMVKKMDRQIDDITHHLMPETKK